MNIAIILLALIGFGISLYGYFVEQKIKQNAEYKPACDLNDQVSCSKAFTSSYGKLFGVANTIAGMVFYLVVMAASWFGYPYIVFYLAIASCIASAIFAYLLVFKVRSYCLVCIAVYVVNVLLLLTSWID